MVQAIYTCLHSHTHSLSLSLSLSPGETYRAMFSEAMSVWSRHTCIQFELATNAEQDHIVYVESEELG